VSAARHLALVPDSADDVVDTTEAAAILGITANGVRDLARRGIIPGHRTARGHWRYPAASVIERAENRECERTNSLAPMPGGQYGSGVSHLDEHCRWMMRAGRAPRTIKMRRMHLQYLAEYLGRDPVDATPSELEAWQDNMPVDQLRFKTAMIRPYFDYLHKRGIRPDNPAALLVTPRAKRGIPRPIAFEALERAIRTDFALVHAWKGDRHGNLVYREAAANFNPECAAAGRITIAEVEHLVEPGEICPAEVHTQGVFVHRVVHVPNPIKRIERETVRAS